MRLIGAAIAAVMLCASAALAAPPPAGSIASFGIPMITCDERDQVVDFLAAIKKDSLSGFERAVLEHADVCRFVLAREVVIGESEDLGEFRLGPSTTHAWVLRLRANQLDYWMLYEELSGEGRRRSSRCRDPLTLMPTQAKPCASLTISATTSAGQLLRLDGQPSTRGSW